MHVPIRRRPGPPKVDLEQAEYDKAWYYSQCDLEGPIVRQSLEEEVRNKCERHFVTTLPLSLEFLDLRSSPDKDVNEVCKVTGSKATISVSKIIVFT